jgi:hypothetical protein
MIFSDYNTAAALDNAAAEAVCPADFYIMHTVNGKTARPISGDSARRR